MDAKGVKQLPSHRKFLEDVIYYQWANYLVLQRLSAFKKTYNTPSVSK